MTHLFHTSLSGKNELVEGHCSISPMEKLPYYPCFIDHSNSHSCNSIKNLKTNSVVCVKHYFVFHISNYESLQWPQL